MDASNLTAWGTFIGVVCAAIGTLVGGLMTLWFKQGTPSRVAIIKAEGDVKVRELQGELMAKDIVIENLTTRIVKLEDETQTLRQQGHDDRNRWYAEQLKCTADAAELRGELKAIQGQFNHFLTLFAEANPRSIPATSPILAP